MKRVFVFNDCFQTKNLILRTVKGFGGVYIFQNKVNGKRYVGSSVDLRNRLYTYLGLSLKSSNIGRVVYNALLKYGLSSFSLTIIIIPDATRDAVLVLEQYVMDSLHTPRGRWTKPSPRGPEVIIIFFLLLDLQLELFEQVNIIVGLGNQW
jgi:hypothetical protein